MYNLISDGLILTNHRITHYLRDTECDVVPPISELKYYMSVAGAMERFVNQLTTYIDKDNFVHNDDYLIEHFDDVAALTNQFIEKLQLFHVSIFDNAIPVKHSHQSNTTVELAENLLNIINKWYQWDVFTTPDIHRKDTAPVWYMDHPLLPPVKNRCFDINNPMIQMMEDF